MAQRALVRSRKWQVISSFKRSFYCCDNDENIICIGQEEIGKGPFTILCSSEQTWPKNVLANIKYLWLREEKLLFEGSKVVFDMQGASIWNKTLSTINTANAHLYFDLNTLANMAAVNAPSESLGYLIPHFFPTKINRKSMELSALTCAIHQRFRNIISEVKPQPIFLNTRFVDNLFVDTLEQLIGLGKGLTPSGDDFLAGIVMGFYKVGRVMDGHYLACHFNRTASERTTIVSLAFYSALSEGLVAEPFRQLLEVIGSGDVKQLVQALARINGMGATSGWDTVAGILFGISLVNPIPNRPYHQQAEAVC